MKKKTLCLWVGLIAAGAVFLTVVFGICIEKRRSADTYRKVENLLPGEHELEKYGVFGDEFVYAPMVVGMALIITASCVGIAALCLKYEKSQNRKFQEIEYYCGQILEGVYDLELQNSEEGQFGILKNKVYDIMVMLNETNHFLEQNKKQMEKMIADISHQLKTPITSLHMINEILYMNLPEEKRMEFLDNMQRDLMKMEWLVKTVLHMAKMDSGTLRLERQEVDAGEFSEEIREHFQVFLEMNGCGITVEHAEGIVFVCDRRWTKEAAGNLIKNAVEHGAEKIRLVWEQNRLYTKLEIQDDGEGIEREELPHVFERFYKTKDSREDSIGLGLAFAKSIVVHQNGEIRVKSKKGEGTTFIIKLYTASL